MYENIRVPWDRGHFVLVLRYYIECLISYILCLMFCLLGHDKVNNKLGKLLTYHIMDDVTGADY